METLRAMLNLQNLLFYLQHGGHMSKKCPRHGWVDNEWEECKTCGQCTEGGK